MTSCSHAINPDGSSNIYKSGIDTTNLEFVKAYKSFDGTKIYINTFYRNRYNYFVGDISGKATDKRILANRIIHLKVISDDKLEKYDKKNPIKIIPYDKWSKEFMPLFMSAIESITPDEPNKGIMVAIANNDYVFYKKDGKLYNMSLDNSKLKDEQIEIVKIFSNADIYKIFFKKVSKNQGIIKNLGKDKLLILEVGDRLKGFNSSYILLDFKGKVQYFFNFSSYFQTRQAFENTDYYVQLFFNAIIKAHIIEPIKNPVTTVQKGSTIVYQYFKKTTVNRNIIEFDCIPMVDNSAEMMDIDEFEKKLDRLVGRKKYKGSMEFLIGGASFFKDFIEEVEKTRNEIFIRLYIFSNDDYGIRIANILKTKSESGVDVRVLTSGLANNAESMKKSALPFDKNFVQPRSIGQYLAYESNVNLRTSADTFFILDHSKMIILDRKIAYAGGMNIGQPYRYSWHDMMIKLKGEEIVNEINSQFNQAWISAGPTGDLGKFSRYVFHKSKKRSVAEPNEADIRILYTKPQKKQIYKSQLLAINNSRKRIYIENPYLADRSIINALIRARQRGVDIRIIVSSTNNWAIMNSNNKVVVNKLLKNGIKVYSYSGMTHIKAAIYDGWAIIGSANFDNLSLNKNYEFNIAFSDPYYVNKLEKELFDVDFGLSNEVTELYEVSWHDEVMSGLANRF